MQVAVFVDMTALVQADAVAVSRPGASSREIGATLETSCVGKDAHHATGQA